MSDIHFTSDLHIGHVLPAEHRWARHRSEPQPADDVLVAWHDELLATNWDAVVRPDDHVWVLGDISSGGAKAQRNALDWIRARSGVKHLVAGNHDDCHPMHRESHKWQRVYLGLDKPCLPAPFASVQMAAKRRVGWNASPDYKGGHVSVYLSHFPYRADRGKKMRYPEWRLKNCGSILLHGHTHFTEKLSHDVNVWDPALPEVPQIHVGVDAWDMAPVHGDVIREMVLKLLGVPVGEKHAQAHREANEKVAADADS